MDPKLLSKQQYVPVWDDLRKVKQRHVCIFLSSSSTYELCCVSVNRGSMPLSFSYEGMPFFLIVKYFTFRMDQYQADNLYRGLVF